MVNTEPNELPILPDGSLLAPNLPGITGGATWCAILAPGGPTGVQRRFLARGAPGSVCHADDVLRPFAPVQFGGRRGSGSFFGVVVRRASDRLDVVAYASPAAAIVAAKELGWSFDVDPTPWKGRKGRGRWRGRREPEIVPPPPPPPADVVALIREAREAVRALQMLGAGADAESLEAAARAVASRLGVEP